MRKIWIYWAFCLIGVSPVFAYAQDTRVPLETLNAIYAMSPAFGDANGVTIVEFYDYQCGYCKSDEEELARLLQEDKNIRIIYADFPKLGPLSLTAATATLAAMRQGMDKYLWFHHILMNKDVHVTDDLLFQAAAYVGLDVGQLKQDMNDPAIAQQIQNSITLGKTVGVRVTPSFIIGDHFSPGFAQYDRLKQMVAYVRQHH